jgi:hypothetical protein
LHTIANGRARLRQSQNAAACRRYIHAQIAEIMRQHEVVHHAPQFMMAP